MLSLLIQEIYQRLPSRLQTLTRTLWIQSKKALMLVEKLLEWLNQQLKRHFNYIHIFCICYQQIFMPFLIILINLRLLAQNLTLLFLTRRQVLLELPANPKKNQRSCLSAPSARTKRPRKSCGLSWMTLKLEWPTFSS